MKELNYKNQKTNSINSIKQMSYIEFRALMNNKQVIYGQLLTPILYYLFYSVGISSTFGNFIYSDVEVSFLKFSFIGIVGIIIFSQMNQSVYRIILDRKWGLLAFKYFKGVTPFVYITGKMVFPLLNFLLQITILYSLSIIMGDYFTIGQFIQIVGLSFLMMLFWFSLGTCISLKVSSYQTRDMILDTLMMPIAFTAPTFFSFDNAPIAIKVVSMLNPLTYQLNTLRDFVFGVKDYRNFIIVLIMTLLMISLAIYSVKNAELTSDER
ncbi:MULTISPECIES: ABC transporter permease [unclassified Granulicatella]|uniref:ABC transporter permease n=1 Tax=unclassified Granulicatella TaxID=2630493 RepID=UPI001073F4EF|nr:MULTISPECIES: ABC transporter permease [unclassified Granulicatella]MBF0780639.1 ABC transporter permease [Granulicatella sp. 19428wC4_WM01]TFU94568.1 ABC transporter permease [Granulicatella sp. WM01]